ncbi:MAG: hypothetical protein GXP02_06775 [Alphaproteobacteria bacterium]|nr:hypothetical protein [Alphaproteobacteria bacterium]
MLRTIFISVIILFTMGVTARAETACRAPLAPAIPNGKTATRGEILAALKIVKKDFQPAIQNFQNCIATERQAVGDVATKDQIAEWGRLFDAAYVLETRVADQMNLTIRAYKARTAKKTKKAEKVKK